jgi:hypothetical protein
VLDKPLYDAHNRYSDGINVSQRAIRKNDRVAFTPQRGTHLSFPVSHDLLKAKQRRGRVEAGLADRGKLHAAVTD